MPSATTAAEASEMLGESITVYLEAGASGAGYEAVGERPGDLSSTIVDATALATGGRLRIVRAGVITRERIAAVVGEELLEAAPGAPAASAAPGAPSAPDAPDAPSAPDATSDAEGTDAPAS
jgi:hypothetical protein